jgi:hypothetical protein
MLNMTRTAYPEPAKYVAWVRRQDEQASLGCPVPRPSWPHSALSPVQWQREKWSALDRRINLRGGAAPKWRRLDPMHQTELRRDQQALAKIRERIRVYQFATPEVRRRFGHLLSRYDD